MTSHRWSPLRRRASLAAVAAAFALTLSACSAGAPEGTPAPSSEGTAVKGGTLTIGVAADVGKFDPVFSVLPTYDQFAYATPVFQTAEGEFTPYLAESWEFADDGSAVTLTLRDDAKFSDGTEVTAEAVADSMNRFRTTPSAKQFQAKQVADVTASGDLDVTLTFTTPVPQDYALTLLSQGNAFGMVAAPSGTADPDSLNNATLGAGPYQLDAAQSTPGDHYTFVENPHYFAPETVTFESIVLKPFADPMSLGNAVTTGQVDMAVSIIAPLAGPAADAGLTISKGARGIGDSGSAMLVLAEHTEGPLADIRVRQAIAYAIPRDDINTSLYGGLATATSSAIPEGLPGHSGEDPFAYDLEKAKQLLAEAGYTDGLELTVVSPSAFDPGNLLGQAVQGALQEAGITVTLEKDESDFTAVSSKIQAGEFDVYVYTEPGEDSYTLVANSLTGPAILNPNGDDLPAEVQAQLDTAVAAPAAEQAAELATLTALVDEQAWYATIVSIPRLTAVAATIQGVPESYVTVEPSPTSPNPGESWWTE